MVSYLRCPALTPMQRRTGVFDLKTPESLEVMYYRILKLISVKISEDQRLARQVFICIAYEYKLFDVQELECAVHARISDPTGVTIQTSNRKSS